MIYHLDIHIKPMTSNHAYPTNKYGRRYLCDEGRKYREVIEFQCRKQIKNFKKPKGKYILKATYVFCKPTFITKKGEYSLTAGDSDGFIKLPKDAITSALKINDAIVWHDVAVKVYQENPRMIVQLEWVPLEDYFDPANFIRLSRLDCLESA